MGIMKLFRDERFVLFGIFTFTFATVHAMVTYMRMLRDDKVIYPTPAKTQYITQETEDALKLDTLDKLLAHPNDSVRNVATKILCDRAMNDAGTMHHLLYGITVEAYEDRKKCLRAIEFLVSQINEGLAKLHNPKASLAIVRALELSLADREIPTLNNSYWDEYPLRDMSEKLPIHLVWELLTKYGECGVTMFLRANLVERWLARQPWGDGPEERRKNFTEFLLTKPNNRVADIARCLGDSPQGYRALQRAGLMQPPPPSPPPSIGLTLSVWTDDTGRRRGGVRRTRGHSAEEQRLRRLHREAMVLNDGTRPLGRDDIIARERD